MLSILRIKNFILMEELELEFVPGLNVLSGETGAGKSVVVGALHLVLGGRANADLVRPGAEEADIEALFHLPKIVEGGSTLARFTDASRDVEGELLIRRVVGANGRSRAYVNGRLATAADLGALGLELADVASQHESVALTDPSTHIEHLDSFARIVDRRGELRALYEELVSLSKEIRDLRDKERARGEREAFLRYVISNIREVDPRPGELDDLSNERRRLRHQTKLVELTSRSAARLDGEEAVLDQLARINADLRAAAELDPSLASLADRVAAMELDLREIADEASRYGDSIDGDPSRLEAVEERLYRLEQLMRQHGPSLDDVIAHRDNLEHELEELVGSETKANLLADTLRERLPVVAKLAHELSKSRKEAAIRLGAAISGELDALGMGGARILVEVEPQPLVGEGSETLAIDGAKLSPNGLDRVEFLIAPNRGHDPKPLRKIASGGELSRALLALKRVLAETSPRGLYVFDEVDAGVGGAVAERIGVAIHDVSRHHQVLCITHLAPIAAFADAHFVVTKTQGDAKTQSSIHPVVGEARVQEVARMLSGARVTRATLDAAKELVEAAAGVKREGTRKRDTKKAELTGARERSNPQAKKR